MHIDLATLLFLLRHPVGPDDRRPSDDLLHVLVLRDLAARFDDAALSRGVDGVVSKFLTPAGV